MIKKFTQSLLGSFGLKIIKLENDLFNKTPVEASNDEKELIKLIRKYSMNSSLRSWVLIVALKEIFEKNIEGDFVETGVWKGGNLILFKKYIQKYNLKDRKIFGYDTFEGMAEPTMYDKDFKNISALEYVRNKKIENYSSYHSKINLDQVKENFIKETGDIDNLLLFKGRTNDTLQKNNKVPDKIAILKLGTCFYESPKFELEIMYEKLQKGGYLIVDDYGWWKGAKLAFDDFFKNNKHNLHFVDHTSRFFIKD
jgi:SAM-dependent methyltransferase